MAGESPDRSERERSSGETTEEAGSVPSARQQDPRQAYAAAAAAADENGADGAAGADEAGGAGEADRAGDDAGDARLRAAVAAWVSTEDSADGGATADEPSTDAPAQDAAEDDDAQADGDGEGVSSDLPVRPRAAVTESSAPAKPAGDTATTMFGVRPEVAEPTDERSAAARAERMTSAFFGSARKPGTESDREDASPADDAADGTDERENAHADGDGFVADAADGTAEPAVETTEAGRDSDDSAPDSDEPRADAAAVPATAASEAVVAGASQDAPAESDGENGAGDQSGGTAARTEAESDGDEGAAKRAAAGSAMGRPTKTPGDKAPGGGPDAGQAAAGAAEPKAGRTEAERDAGSGDPATAVFRAVAPGAGTTVPAKAGTGAATAHDGRPGKQAAPEDHPTTAIRLPREAKPAPDAKDRDRGESRYVPLRTAEEARRPSPDAETTGTSAPPSAITGVGGEQERTRQQPVPEPPPLELLAQLTNTPPPPETPIRTAVRRVKIWTPLVLLLAIVFVIVQAVRPLPEPTLTLTEQATYTFDGGEPSLPWPGEGQAYVEVSGLGVLGSYGEQKPVPIGSVAKTMTAYLVLQKSPLEEGEDGPDITIDQKAEDGGNRGAGNGNESVLPSVEKGDKISQRDALSALMIPSANNIARLLARWHSGSEEAFVEKMNETAAELGMENTTYTDPSGLEETTVSTAEDQVKLGKKVMEIPALVAITKLPYWKDPFSGERMRNWNTVVSSAGAIGIKTGTTTVAGGNLLFAGYEEVGDTRQLVVGAVLGQHRPPIIDTVNAVSHDLLIAAGETLTSEKIVEKGDVVGYLDDGLGGRTPVVATEDVAAVGWGGIEVDLALEPLAEMPHAASAGKEVGTLTVGGGPGQVEVPVALKQDLTEPAFGDKLTRVL